MVSSNAPADIDMDNGAGEVGMKHLFQKVLMAVFTPVFRGINAVIHVLKISKFVRIVRQASWKAKLAELGNDTVIYAAKKVSIGSRCAIAEFVHIWGGGGIIIGDDVIIASHAVITSQSHDKNATCYRESSFRSKVVIGNNVWIGAGAIILPGVALGSGSIIGAGAVVTRDVQAGTIVAGVPARIIENISA